MADRIKNYQQEADQITTLKAIRTDLGVTPSSYTPDATVVTKDRVVTFAQAEEEMVVLSDIEKGVKQQVVKGDIADKRLTNIEKLLQGNLYDYQTDSTSAYTKSVPAGAMPYAGIEQIGGKTVVWNQLVDSGTTTVPTINGRKYYTLIDGTASIVTADGTAISVVDDTADMVFDLTLMFGSGNEPSTTADFTAIFGATHYSYNAGTLLSAGVTEVKSVGKNLLNLDDVYSLNSMQKVGNVFENTAVDTRTVAYLNMQVYNGGRIIVNQTPSYDGSDVRKTTFTLTEGATRIVIGHSGSVKDEKVSFDISLEKGKTYTASIKLTGNSPNVLGGFSFTDVQVEESATATAYSPYFKNTTSIPASIQALDSYGASTHTETNTIDFEQKKYIQKVKVVNLGDLNWIINANYGGYPAFYTTDIIFSYVADYAVPDMLCSRYSVVSRDTLYGSSDAGICLTGTGNVRYITVRDTSYADVASFKAGVNGVEVCAVLRDSIETDISAYLTDDNLIEVEAGGTLTFPNSNGDDYRLPVPSEETYMIDLQEAVSNG